jgi:hypothetical protein
VDLVHINSNQTEMISNLIVCVTLLMNAGAVLNFKLKSRISSDLFEESNAAGLGNKVREFLSSLQSFRIFIAIWNVFIMILMLL